jgi:hypothetical protein
MLNPAGSPENISGRGKTRKTREKRANWQSERAKIERAGLVSANPARLACIKEESFEKFVQAQGIGKT